MCTGVMLANFHNDGMTPDLNAELNKSAKGVDSSFEQSRKIREASWSGPDALLALILDKIFLP